MTTLFDQISQDIVAAMKAKDKVRLEALRNVKKYFIEAKTAPGANDELSDDAALKILAKLVKQGRDTAALYTEQQRPDLAEAELAQVAVIEAYLPKALTHEELEAALRSIIAEGQASGELSSAHTINEMVKLYALCERALMYDWCLDGGDYSLRRYAAKTLPSFLSSFSAENISENRTVK